MAIIKNIENEAYINFKNYLKENDYNIEDIIWRLYIADSELHNIGYIFDPNIECYGFYMPGRAEDVSIELENFTNKMKNLIKKEK